jgi:hypothetical protein
MRTIIVAGRGPSAYQYHWPDDGTPIMAVSGGYDAVPDMEHFVSLDKPMCFPRWLLGADHIEKHVAENRHTRYWRRWPNITSWPYVEDDFPRNGGPPVVGPLGRGHSLLFAVQVAARMGYQRLLFVGVDLLGVEMEPVNRALESWRGWFADHGVELVNASPLSALCEWMPFAGPGEAMVLS